MKDFIKIILWAVLIFLAMVGILAFCVFFFPDAEGAEIKQQGYASWYSYESSIKEGCSGIMANGRRLDDKKFICASWDYPFGTILKITNLGNRKIVLATVSDRGPTKKLYRAGRILDLSKASFMQIADLKQGIIRVKVERIK